MNSVATDLLTAIYTAVSEFVPDLPGPNASCHHGICSEAQCGHCTRVRAANVALEQLHDFINAVKRAENPETAQDYYCEAWEIDQPSAGASVITAPKMSTNRIGSFTISATTMSEALIKAGRNIEVILRPTQYELRVKLVDDARKERA